MADYDSDDLLDEGNSQDDSDGEADRLLEEMRQLNRDVAAAVDSVEGKTLSFNDESDDLHSKLNSKALDIINDVKLGRDPDEPPPSDPTVAPALDDYGPPGEEMWQPPEMPETPAPLFSASAAASSAAAEHPDSLARRPAGGGRFKAAQPPQPQVEAKSLVSDISKLASRPLLDDIAPMPRRPGGRGLASGSTMGRGLASGSAMGRGLASASSMGRGIR